MRVDSERYASVVDVMILMLQSHCDVVCVTFAPCCSAYKLQLLLRPLLQCLQATVTPSPLVAVPTSYSYSFVSCCSAYKLQLLLRPLLQCLQATVTPSPLVAVPTSYSYLAETSVLRAVTDVLLLSAKSGDPLLHSGWEPVARVPHAARVTFSNGPPVYFATVMLKTN